MASAAPVADASGVSVAVSTTGNEPLAEVDAELFDLIEDEKYRQWSGLELIASENFTSQAVIDCLGSCLTNKYAEGYPGRRYYGGNEVVDKIERLAQARALKAFELDGSEWGVNVQEAQAYSGSPANMAVYTALLSPGDRIMGLDLPSGGHLTHGFFSVRKDKSVNKVSATSRFFESMPYKIDPATGMIDYDEVAKLAAAFKPRILVTGFSAYCRDLDYKRFREIADSVGAILMADVAHIAGLVAKGESPSPFEHCDVVTTTTHKSLRGPRAALIFSRVDKGFPKLIDSAIFPGLQGGPHENAIAAIATQMREVATPAFKAYAQQIRANAVALATALTKAGYKLVSGGTDNHLVLWDLRPQGLTGSKLEKVCDAVHITLNKNSVHGDRSAFSPGGVRVGTPALTTRGFKEADFVKVAGFLARCVDIALDVQKTSGPKLKDFVPALPGHADVQALRAEVQEFATAFPMPGMDVAPLLKRYQAESAKAAGTSA